MIENMGLVWGILIALGSVGGIFGVFMWIKNRPNAKQEAMIAELAVELAGKLLKALKIQGAEPVQIATNIMAKSLNFAIGIMDSVEDRDSVEAKAYAYALQMMAEAGVELDKESADIVKEIMHYAITFVYANK